MHGTLQKSANEARETIRHDWRSTDISVGDVLADISKRILWQENTAPFLAAATGCSVRQAERFLGGHCEWSGAAVTAIVSEILKRHSLRSVKSVPRK